MSANENSLIDNRRLGRSPSKSDPRTLMFSHYRKTGAPTPPPASSNYWKRKAPFPPKTWGNDVEGCCTVAKQANAARRFERMERRRTIEVTTEEVHRVYRQMTAELYGGGDTGAYEEDALSRSRHPETCLHDKDGHPLLTDAFLRVNAWDQMELKSAIHLSAGHGIAVCLNLPNAFSRIDPPQPWDVPEGQPLLDDWMAGSWGGHSLWAIAYSKEGIVLEHTWGIPPQLLTWRAAAAYLDEAHIVIDSVNAWKKRVTKSQLDIAAIVADVNSVSSQKIKS